MATARLSREDKSTIDNRLSNYCNRLKYQQEDPIGLDRIDFIKSIVGKKFVKHYTYLENSVHKDAAVAVTTHYAFRLEAPQGVKNNTYFQMQTEKEWARLENDQLIVPKTHPLYYSLLQFGAEHIAMCRRVYRATGTIHSIVASCSSVGQIQRVIPDLLQLIPNSLSMTIHNAERRSRMPVLDTAEDGTCSKERITEMLATLALGTLKKDLDNHEKRRCLTAG